MFFSLIVPIFNRPDEAEELLASLAEQTYRNFELVLIEDGSTQPCDAVVAKYIDKLNINYYQKSNSGPGDSRNFGMQKAKGAYFIFVDSDCIIPQNYFENIYNNLNDKYLDCFGGPDAAHESFSDTQKAINQAMTSFITTGGIRGGKKQLDKFQPRSFNMGFSRVVYEKVGGFATLHPGEDPDLSYRIMAAGFSTSLIADAYVWHKRRIDFDKFRTQVYKFGIVRVILCQWHPNTCKLVYFLPSIFYIGTILLSIIAFLLLITTKSILVSIVPLLFLVLFTLIVFLEAILTTKSLKISVLTIRAAWVQLLGYGRGFLEAWWKLKIQGIVPQVAFPNCFFDKKIPTH